ncbi:MAG: tRNA epoxyqueuosine(34) reductase QueG [Candidatus Promineifilaceae bacterium]
MADLLPELIARAHRLGFDFVGVSAASPARRLDAYLEWVKEGRHGEMGYMARPDRVERRQDPQVILPGVKSIISVGLSYSTMKLPPQIANDPARGRISNYAWGLDYHDVMEPRLEELAAWLGGKDAAAKHRIYVDTGAILERDHAETAGLGFTGKNTMLIAPRGGSWLFLGELLTTMSIPPTPPPVMPSCGSCRRCLDACPTGAFPAAYELDARRCISYLTIELKGWIPRDLRPLMGNWIYGCDICQDVCPFNRFAKTATEPAFQPHNLDAMAPPLVDILALDEAQFNERFANSPIKRIKRGRLLRNACVAAGNWGDTAAVPALANLLTDPEPLIRGHAAWALSRIGGGDASGAIAGALRTELDERVRIELRNKA